MFWPVVVLFILIVSFLALGKLTLCSSICDMNSPIFDREKVTAFNMGEHKALEAVFNRHYRALWYFAHSLIDDKWEAEDIVVDSFLKLWKLRDNFETDQNMKAFLYITTRNACFNYLKHVEVRRYSHKELRYLHGEVIEENVEDVIDCKIIESEVLREIVHEVKSLPPAMNAVFKLLLHGLSTDEISRKLNLSPATIRVQKSKAIKVIRLALARKKLLPVILIILLRKELIDWFCT